MTLRTTTLLAFLLACGGSEGDETTTTTTTTTGGETQADADPWATHTGETLRDYVRERAFAKLASVQPEVTAEALTGWIASPDEAPELSGRAVERLFDIAAVHTAAGELEQAEGIVRLVRAKARNRNSAYAGNTLLCEVARREAGDDAAAQQEAIAGALRELPRTRFGSATVIFQIFQTQEQLGAQLGQIHEQLLSLETASTALFFEQLLPPIVEHRERFLAAIEAVRAEHAEQPALEDYEFGTVDLEGARDARAVRIGVWDLGTNPALFEDQLFTNPNEEDNGEDDDDDGLVDDIHGVVHAIANEWDHDDLLYEPGDEVVSEYSPFLRGIMDLRAGLASSEAAQRVLTLMRSVTDPAELEALEQNLDKIGEWAHGTHVAGIMVSGLPQAELAVFRSVWAGEARIYHHRGPTDEELAAERENVENIAAFINAHGIKVVNASLGFSREYVASALRHERDRYQTDEAVQARADAIHAHRAATWARAFELCPNTLFVVAAGNSNEDVVEYEVVPASIAADNVITVGAVDRYGEWATFTNSNPERVRIFDWGVEVPSLIPDGTTVPLSGTSMASPNVANLAAKLYALNPELTPAQVRTIIEETGDAIEAPFSGVIANETAAVERVRSERPRRRR